MKSLEDKIIRKVYVMETKKMSVSFILRLIAFFFFGGMALLLMQVLWELLSEEKTLNVLSILNDDAEIIRSYAGDIAGVIFQETPKELLAAIAVFLGVFLFLVLTLVRNFGKIRHKMRAIINYWRFNNS